MRIVGFTRISRTCSSLAIERLVNSRLRNGILERTRHARLALDLAGEGLPAEQQGSAVGNADTVGDCTSVIGQDRLLNGAGRRGWSPPVDDDRRSAAARTPAGGRVGVVPALWNVNGSRSIRVCNCGRSVRVTYLRSDADRRLTRPAATPLDTMPIRRVEADRVLRHRPARGPTRRPSGGDDDERALAVEQREPRRGHVVELLRRLRGAEQEGWSPGNRPGTSRKPSRQAEPVVDVGDGRWLMFRCCRARRSSGWTWCKSKSSG
jgi:hypothetical protein